MCNDEHSKETPNCREEAHDEGNVVERLNDLSCTLIRAY